MNLYEAKKEIREHGYVLEKVERPWEEEEKWNEIKNKKSREWLNDDDKKYLLSISLFDKYRQEILEYMKRSGSYDLDNLNPKYNEEKRLEDGIEEEWLKDNGAEPFAYSYWMSLRDDFSRKIHADHVWRYVKRAERDEHDREEAIKYREMQARIKEMERKEREEMERLRKEDPKAYYDKYVKNTSDDPSWRGPNGNWSLD